tara:strand:+ start:5908 stop:6198 length:291 start_codon:yes stop_codon:yes gene_type:complete
MVEKKAVKSIRNGNSSALKDHMLKYHRVSQIDALVIFGVQSLTKFITMLRRDGFCVNSETVPMIRAIVRVNKYCVIKAPKNLPTKEVYVTEYWISR